TDRLLHIHNDLVRVGRTYIDIAEHIDDLNRRSAGNWQFMMFVIRIVVAGDVPEIQISKIGVNVQVDVGGRRDRASGKNYQNQQCDFAAGEQWPVVVRASGMKVLDDLHESPCNDHHRPVAREHAPYWNWISKISREEQTPDRDKNQPPENGSYRATHL